MNSKNVLKVNVNGSKYLITGIKPSTSCKDLLCALAKATNESSSYTCDDKIDYKNEMSIRKLYNTRKIDDENLVEKLKTNLKTAGELESYKVLTNLSKNVRITKRTSNHEKYINPEKNENFNGKRQSSRKERRSKKPEEEYEKQKTKRRNETTSKRKKSKTIYEEYDTIYERKTRKRIVKRSVDDSDIDNYCNEKVLRTCKKHRSRVFDDSDLDMYKSLFSVVRDQTRHIANMEREKRNLQKNEWIKSLHRNSQIYYIDKNMEENLSKYEKDIDNDSGLPSPEYDSSMESNPPIKTPELLKKPITAENELNVLKNEDISNEKLSVSNDCKCGSRDNLFENSKQIKDESLNNNDYNDILPNNLNCNIIPNENKSLYNQNKNTNQVLLNTELEKNSCQADGFNSQIKKEKTRKDLKRNDNLFIGENINDELHVEEGRFQKQCNTINISQQQNKMVAFEAILSRKSQVENKKLDKKKINKGDISNPVLLSPSTFKKHKVLLNVNRSLLLSDGEENGEEARNESKESIENFSEDKIKSFNRKIKELKKRHNKSRSNKDSTKQNNVIYKENNKREEIDDNNISQTNNEKGKIVDDVEKMTMTDEMLDTKESRDIVCENKDLFTLSTSSNTEANDSLQEDSESLKQASDDEIKEREEMLIQYEEEKKLLDDIIIQVIEYNLYIADLNEQIQTLSSHNSTLESLDSETYELDDEESSIYSELESIQTLLRTVTQATTLQKGEMTKNLALLDKLDIEVKAKKAGIVNLKTGKVNYLAAPRPLLKNSRRKGGEEKSTSFV